MAVNEERIWKYLIGKIENPYGVAGLMGNLFVESGLNPKNLQSSYEKKLGHTDDTYTQAVDNGTYSADSFAHDCAGYGLAQWTYWSRKQSLLRFARSRGASIGDLDMQLEFLWSELQAYSAVLNILTSAKSVREASDVVLTKLEKPANQGESVKANRAEYGQKYYDLYHGVEEGSDDMATNHDKYMKSTGTHYISNSGSDEKGGYTGGAAGDQNSKEWCLKAWYNRPWNYVLRWPNQAVAEKIAKLGIDAALNDKIGYDQNQRTSYWTQLSKVGYEASKVTVACEEDCTAGVSSNVRACGYLFGIASLKNIPICSSRNMRSEFKKAGFIVLTDSKYLTSGKYLLPGDILLYENHHAATNVTLGSAVREQWNPASAAAVTQINVIAPVKETVAATVKPPYVTVSASVNVRKGPSTDYATMGTIKDGEKVHYFGYTYPENGWLLVEFNGQTGWVSGKYGKVAS